MIRTAILISEETLPLIRETGALREGDAELLAECVNEKTRYFSPRINEPAYENGEQPTWATWPSELFERIFVFDKDLIRTQFVDIVRK